MRPHAPRPTRRLVRGKVHRPKVCGIPGPTVLREKVKGGAVSRNDSVARRQLRRKRYSPGWLSSKGDMSVCWVDAEQHWRHACVLGWC